MRFPQVTEKVKEAPANALRSAFARVGQLLLITDRMKNKSGDSEQTAPEDAATATATEEAPAATAETPASSEAAGPAAADVAAGTGEAEAPAGTGAPPGTAEAGTAEAPAVTTVASGTAETKAPAKKPAARKPATKKPTTTSGNVRLLPDEAGAAVSATAPEVPAADFEIPLANYDQLTVASLRARLRGLSIDQVRMLITYEQGHENRADVVAMFERRVAKLESES